MGASAVLGMLAVEDMSFGRWALESLGLFGLLAPLLGIAILIGAMLVVFLSRRPAVIASYLVFVPLPLLLALFQVAKGLVGAYSVLSMSDVELKNSELASGLAECWLSIAAGLLGTMPAYLVIAVGLFIRTLQAGGERAAKLNN